MDTTKEDMITKLTLAAQVYITKTKFDTVVEMYKMGLMSMGDFIKTVEQYTNGVTFNEGYAKKMKGWKNYINNYKRGKIIWKKKLWK